MPYDMAYQVKLVAKMLTGNKELSNELDRRQDGHATLAVARILSSVDKALKGGHGDGVVPRVSIGGRDGRDDEIHVTS